MGWDYYDFFLPVFLPPSASFGRILHIKKPQVVGMNPWIHVCHSKHGDDGFKDRHVSLSLANQSPPRNFLLEAARKPLDTHFGCQDAKRCLGIPKVWFPIIWRPVFPTGKNAAKTQNWIQSKLRNGEHEKILPALKPCDQVPYEANSTSGLSSSTWNNKSSIMSQLGFCLLSSGDSCQIQHVFQAFATLPKPETTS